MSFCARLTDLQSQLDNVSEKNRILEVDHVTLKESVKVLQNEAVLLNNENKYIRMEFEKVDSDLKCTRDLVEEMNGKITGLKTKVKNANDNEFLLQDKVIKLIGILKRECFQTKLFTGPKYSSSENNLLTFIRCIR